MENKSIQVIKSDEGFGGPLIIAPNGEKNKVLYLVGGGSKPKIVDKIEKLTGMSSVNGFEETIEDSEVAVAIIDCGGTLRCGIYPQKGIPTINILPTGQSGPLAKYITEDIYVSGVGLDQISLNVIPKEQSNQVEDPEIIAENEEEVKVPQEQLNFKELISQIIPSIIKNSKLASKVFVDTIIPLTLALSAIISVLYVFNLNNVVSNFVYLLFGNIYGLLIFSILSSLPKIAPILSAGGIYGQILSMLIGFEIYRGTIPPQLALPALFAVNTFNASDFTPVGLSMQDSDKTLLKTNIKAVNLSKSISSIPRVLIAWLISLFLF